MRRDAESIGRSGDLNSFNAKDAKDAKDAKENAAEMARKGSTGSEEENEFKGLKSVVRCPKCGGADVVYTCEPKCCFNHVCADCRASFELTTRSVQGKAPVRPEIGLPESSDPTVACAVCQGLRVYVTQDSMLACADCGSVLKLAYESISVD